VASVLEWAWARPPRKADTHQGAEVHRERLVSWHDRCRVQRDDVRVGSPCPFRTPRLPRSLRWLIGAGVAIKARPAPDLGIDEAMLASATTWLVVPHRDVLQAILIAMRKGGAAGSGVDREPEAAQKARRCPSRVSRTPLPSLEALLRTS
jgi:hypothetical protein